MKESISSLVVVLLLGMGAIVHGQATRTWVSGVGDDVNPCSRTAPCKTFAGAISKTASGGEINCLDPGGYGSVTITKSLTIDCRGTIGSTLASGTNGFIVNIPDTDAINTFRLRGVNVNGAGTIAGANGVRVLSASKVYIEDVIIDGFIKAGVSIENTAGEARVMIYRSSIRNVTETGVSLVSKEKGTGVVIISDSLVSGNGIGITATSGTVTVSGSSVTFNKTGTAASGSGKIVSTKTNTFVGNGTNGPSSTAPLN